MSTLVIILVLIAVVGAIALLAASVNHNQQKKEMAKLLRQFNRLGANNNINFSSQEVLSGTIIGLDGVQRKLLIMRKEKSGALRSRMIDLADVKTCSVVKHYGPIHTDRYRSVAPEQLLEKIVLRFTFNNDETEEVTFYHYALNSVIELTSLSNKARHWETILNKLHTPLKKIA